MFVKGDEQMNTRFDELLKSKGVSRYQVFKATGVPQSSLSDFLSGKSTPKYENMKKLADYFGVSVEYLLGNEQKEKPSGRTSEELDEELKFALFGGGDVTDAQFEEVKKFARFLKERDKKD